MERVEEGQKNSFSDLEQGLVPGSNPVPSSYQEKTANIRINLDEMHNKGPCEIFAKNSLEANSRTVETTDVCQARESNRQEHCRVDIQRDSYQFNFESQIEDPVPGSPTQGMQLEDTRERDRKMSRGNPQAIVAKILSWLFAKDVTDPNVVSPQSIPEDFSMEGPFEKRLQKFLSPRMIYSPLADGDKSSITVNLASLQQAHLHRIRKILIRQAIDFVYGDPLHRDPEWSMIHEYRQALEDWDYIKRCALKGEEGDPFIATTKDRQDCVYISEAFRDWGKLQDGEKNQQDDESRSNVQAPSHTIEPSDLISDPGGSQIDLPHGTPGDLRQQCRLDGVVRNRGDQEPWGGSRNKGNNVEAIGALMHRLGMALTGGTFLIAPTLIMVLHPGQLTALLTTSVCVFVFGLIMALYLDNPVNVLSATAAYAAVLVVFIGSDGSG